MRPRRKPNRTAAQAGVLRLVRPLPAGKLFVDAGAARRGGGVVAFGAPDEETAAALLSLHADRLLDAVPPGAGTVAVRGDGMLANLVRTRLADHGDGDTGRTHAVIDTTGDPAVLSRSLKDLQDRGSLILAVTPADLPWDVDPYPDLHGRGLIVRGVPRPSSTAGLPQGEDLSEIVRGLDRYAEGEPVRQETTWLMVTDRSA